MMKRANQPRFVEEHRHERFIVIGDREVERLDDDLALEATEAGRTGEIHVPHSPRRQVIQYFVPPDSLYAEHLYLAKARSPYTCRCGVTQELVSRDRSG